MCLRNDTTYEYGLRSENRKYENELEMPSNVSIFSILYFYSLVVYVINNCRRAKNIL